MHKRAKRGRTIRYSLNYGKIYSLTKRKKPSKALELQTKNKLQGIERQ